jgi:ATP-dependent Clp endopeptidase proteolytic subunit ClpP|tara:strand:+ start:512 stop:1498 length:987 start_codon:yes stop_codon:yes gene_type:complete
MNNWYDFQNLADSVEISIYDEIGDYGTSAKQFIDDLKSVGGKDIVIRMNSVGGSVFDGLAIYNVLRSHTGYVNVKIEGLSASIASIIALAGDNIEMAENGFFMIHNPFGKSMGGAEDMRKTADLLDKIKQELVNIYSSKTQLSEETISNMMDEETWLTSQEAKEMGFIDTITEPIKVAASFDFSKFTNVDSKEVNNRLQLITNIKKSKMTEELKSWFNGVKEEIINAVKGEVVAEAPVKEEVSVVLSDNEEITNKLTDLSNEKEELTSIISEKETAISELENKVSEMEAEIAKLNATETKVEADNDPAINEADTVVNEWDAFAKSILK